MAKFDFPMEQVFQVKKKLEKQKQLELGKAMQTLSKSQERLLEIEGQLHEANQRFQINLSTGRVNSSEMKSAHERIRYFHQAMTEQKKLIRQDKLKVEEAKEALKTALQDRKIFESLKEKAFESYIENEKLEEAKRLDEIVSYKYRNS